MKKQDIFDENGVRLRRCSLFTVYCSLKRGISLMEVLASTFVIGVGLLGVLAVIPFGAFQVGKANNADYAANMLREAVNEILVRELAKPEKWNDGATVNSNFDTDKVYTYNTSTGAKTLNCQPIVMVDPFDVGTTNPTNIYKVGRMLARPAAWQETMRGQDDLSYTIPEDKRTVLTTSAAMKYVSSGKYTWFFTFKPDGLGSATAALNSVPPASIDVLACFNRTAGDAVKERTVNISGWASRLSGAQLTLNGTASALAVENTKWIFVTWETSSTTVDGCWCKIVSRSHYDTSSSERQVTVIGDLPSTVHITGANYPKTPRAFIVDGVLDHARIGNVPLY